ncbi:hypothetical protein DRJ25_00710 [Candidatus Woesearchaeota archaeon]|nr:MAG: hypothetical protein DRJ25_00710 [Candidatus Woesearchaeota archaeon]
MDDMIQTKKTPRTILAAILISTLIILTSCTQIQERATQYFNSRKENTQEQQMFQTGTEGLNIRFLNIQPKIREGALFDIIFELQNKGYNDITEGIFKLITEKPQITTKKDRGSIILKGKNKYNPEGETKRIKFKAKAGTIEQNLAEYPTKATLIVCYAYENVATEMVCIDPDIEGLQKSKPCIAEDIILPEGQGSPVAVTEIKPQIELTEKGIRPAFEIHIKNEGQGQVIPPDYIEHACGPKQKTKIRNNVQIEATLSNKELTCSPKEINLKKGEETTIYCEQTQATTKRQTYLAPLEIKIKYGYVISASGDITITKRKQ